MVIAMHYICASHTRSRCTAVCAYDRPSSSSETFLPYTDTSHIMHTMAIYIIRSDVRRRRRALSLIIIFRFVSTFCLVIFGWRWVANGFRARIHKRKFDNNWCPFEIMYVSMCCNFRWPAAAKIQNTRVTMEPQRENKRRSNREKKN